MSVSDLFLGLHDLLLLAAAGVAGVHMGVTILNRFHLRRIILSWLDPDIFRPRVWITAGAVLAAGVLARFLLAFETLSVGAFAGYLLVLTFACISYVVSQTVAVTEYGIVCKLNRNSRHIAWGQVEDYFTRPNGRGVDYIFLYKDTSGHIQRFELWVPNTQQASLQRILLMKLDERFYYTTQHVYGRKTLQ